MVIDTIQKRWYIHPMVKHGPILITFIMRKLKRLVMYVLRWQQMGSILMDSYLPGTLVGLCSLSRSISPWGNLSTIEHILVVDNS
jgi:hypothetical protein